MLKPIAIPEDTVPTLIYGIDLVVSNFNKVKTNSTDKATFANYLSWLFRYGLLHIVSL